MATDCCCNPSVANVLCIHLLAYDEMRFYQTCKTIYTHQHERREWWQHVRQLDGLAFHTTPGMGQRSWNCFTVWRSFNIDLVTPSPNESISTESDSECYNPFDDSDKPLCEHWVIALYWSQYDRRTHMRAMLPG